MRPIKQTLIAATAAALGAPAEAFAQAAKSEGAGAAGFIKSLRDQMGVLTEKLREIGTALGDFGTHAGRLLDLTTDFGGWPVLWRGLALAAGVLIVAFALEWLAKRRMGGFVARLKQSAAATRRGRFLALAVGALIEIFEAALFLIAAAAASSIAFGRADPMRDLVMAVALSVFAVRVAVAVARIVFAPHAPALRLIAWDDDAARRGTRAFCILAILAAIGYFGGGFLRLVGLVAPLTKLWELVFGTAIVLQLIWVVWHGRKAAAAAWTRGVPENSVARTLIGIWHIPATLYLVLMGAIWAFAAVVERPAQARAVIWSFVLIHLLPVADWLAARLIDWLFGDRERPAETKTAGPDVPAPVRRGTGKVLLIAIRVVLVTIFLVSLVEAWGIPVVALLDSAGMRPVVRGLFQVLVAVLLATLAWEGIKFALRRYLGESQQQPQPEGHDPVPGSRGTTLLPIVRTFALITLAVILGLIVLSSVGIDIGPLLAGAGVVGLALGFGAQALVRDIVSGFFFLVDDAFRLGEYIDVGKVKGTVEKITIRSVQLRHHRGALHTVPYGRIEAISNFTRDWTIEKLEFGLKYGTDPEKVRKLIKKIGQDLAKDPEVAPHLIETLKSQGIKQFGDSAIIFRAKFKTVPNQQFVVKREALRRIQEAFVANGIEFAFPTVSISSDATPEEAAMAAAKTVAKEKPAA
jgi:small-conductance mechanosensitive channel